MNAAPSLWVRTRAGISRTATSLRLGASEITSHFSMLFYVLTVPAATLGLLCGAVVLLGELWIFLRAPLGFKDESLTGIPALAGIVGLASAGGALAFWFVAQLFGSLSDHWRRTSYSHSGISASGREEIERGPLPSYEAGTDVGSPDHRSVTMGNKLGIYASWIARDEDLEEAVQAAMSDTRATSESDMGRVIQAARNHLGGKGKRFNETELRNAVRERLLGK